MIEYKVESFKRNPALIKSYFTKNSNNTIVKKRVTVIFPKRYIAKELAYINTDNIRVVGIYAIADKDNNYAVMRTPIYHELNPADLSYAKIGGVEYVLVEIEENTIFLLDNKLVVSDKFVYDIFEEFISQGNVPWYLDYEDLAKLFEQGEKYANVKIGNNPITFEIITAVISRKANDKTQYYRYNPTGRPAYIGLNDTRYGFNNTGSRLIGNYFKEGIVTAIVEPEQETSDASKILRR